VIATTAAGVSERAGFGGAGLEGTGVAGFATGFGFGAAFGTGVGVTFEAGSTTSRTGNASSASGFSAAGVFPPGFASSGLPFARVRGNRVRRLRAIEPPNFRNSLDRRRGKVLYCRF
jgi:hypothetical protein